MERVKIDELCARRLNEGHERPDFKDIGAFVFEGDLARPRDGNNREDLSEGRKANLIGSWNRGRELTAMKPRHLLRLAEFFGVSDVHDLLHFS